MVRPRLWCSSLALLLAACSSAEPGSSAAPVVVSVQPIIGGTPATEYPEAAILDIDRGTTGTWYACSATLIAPRAALTAGHCVDGHTTWSVQVHGETRLSTSAVTYDWAEGGAETVNPSHHDIGLVFFDDPIVLDTYPTLALSPLPDESTVVNVGRILDGTFTWTSHQATAVVRDGAWIGYPFDYESADVIQPGDSGGGVFAQGTHMVVAVNSGAGSGIQVLARVDLLRAWIDEQVAAHDPSPPPPPPPPPPPDVCAPEVEANDTVGTATPIVHRVCGALDSASDIDWVTFDAPRGTFSVSLVADHDAVFALGKLAFGKCELLASDKQAVRVTTSARATPLCAKVSSPSGQTQTYTFKAE